MSDKSNESKELKKLVRILDKNVVGENKLFNLVQELFDAGLLTVAIQKGDSAILEKNYNYENLRQWRKEYKAIIK